MKTKDIIYIIAAIGAVVLFVMDKDLEYVSGAILIILLIASKFEEKQAESKASNLKEENKALRVMHKAEFRKNQLNTNTMVTNAHLEILQGQAEWVRNYSGTHPEEAAQVIEQQIANINLLKGSTINPTLTPPPPNP